MFFKRKSDKGKIECMECSSKVDKSYSFCPHCGFSLKDEEQELKDLGLLGNSDAFKEENVFSSMGISEKFISSIMQSLMKNLDTQVKSDNTEIQNFPNGIKIKIGLPQKKKENKAHKREITEEQLNRMSKLPRKEAKTNLRRLSDKVVYELSAPGIQSVEDVFVSKLESGYEIKALGKTKVYVTSLPVSLPLKKYSITDKKIIMEFGLQ
ncbi:MAG: hypothetical protein AABW80_05305 [Nanoarchaeota archaeon]